MHKSFHAFWAFLSVVSLLAAQELPVELDVPAPQPIAYELPVSPLTVNGSQEPEIDLGKVFKLTNRFFQVVVENPSDEPVKYTNIVVNCECTTIQNKIPVPGEIPAHGKLKLLLRLNAGDLSSRHFFRMIRFELEGYRQFQVSFTGELDTSLYMTYYDEPEPVKHGEVMIGYLEDPNEPWETRLNITLDAEEGELKLGKIKCTKNFIAALHRFDERHWQVELHAVNPVALGELRDAVVIQLEAPRPAEGQQDVIVLPIQGICGTRIVPTTEEIYLDKEVAPEQYERKILLERLPFLDKLSIVRMFRGQQSPYMPEIKVLTVDEVKVPDDVPGVEFELTQEKVGVVVTIKMTRDEMVMGGYPAVFEVKNSQPAEVWIGLLAEERRKQFEEDAAAAAEAAAAEAAAQAEQDAIK